MLFLALEVVAYHGLSRAMEKRTVKTKRMSHLYVVILHLLFCYYFFKVNQGFVFQRNIIEVVNI